MLGAMRKRGWRHGASLLVLSSGLAWVAAGCSDDQENSQAGASVPAPSVPAAVPAAPNWYQHVAPLVSARCSGCHRPQGIAPFSLTSYESARPFAAAMAGAVNSGKMPPWHAVETDECRPRYGWKDDVRLSAAEKLLIERWAATGAAAGESASPAPLPAPPAVELPDRSGRVSMARAFALPAGGRDVYRCFPLPHVFEQDSWLTGLQVVPGNNKVVHHVLVWLDWEGEGARRAGAEGSYPCFGAPGFESALLGAWAPGAVPVQSPPDAGIRIPRGSRIVMNVHYHPSNADAADSDLSGLDLRWTTTAPTMEVTLGLLGNAHNMASGLLAGPADPPEGPAFLIPAGAKGHDERMAIPLGDNVPVPVRVFAVGTHMHYVGTGMKMEVDRSQRVGGPPAGEPTRECLIETPRWDFHWQRGYYYQAPIALLPTVMKGDAIQLRCRYDNSMDNPFVAAALKEQNLLAPRPVALGEQTLDEMCLGILGVVHPPRRN